MEFLVNIDIDDLDKGIAFYEAAFELRVGRRFGRFGVEMVGGSASVFLLVKDSDTTASTATAQRRTYERHWTPVHLDFIVDDIEAAVEKAVAAGATLEQAAATHAWGRLALLADPFGHGFCLIQFRGRGYDEISD